MEQSKQNNKLSMRHVAQGEPKYEDYFQEGMKQWVWWFRFHSNN